MKIAEGHFLCDWCRLKFKKAVSFYVSPDQASHGKQNVTATVKCPDCGQNVSQKTRFKITGKT